MKRYKQIEVTETKLEDLLRVGTDLIEDGLVYLDHQRSTDKGRLDVLLIDSGKSAVVAELKVTEDDSMLFQGIDYYDYVSTNIEAIARLYKKSEIDPTQPVRLILIAPSFSQSLINRCKWVDIYISLFIYKCIQFEDSDELTPVFTEISIPSQPEVIEKYTIEERLSYITVTEVRNILESFIKQLPGWKKDRILIEPIKYSISVKVNGRVFMYLSPRRDKFLIETNNTEGKWTAYHINSEEDLKTLIDLLKDNMEKKSK